MDPVAEKKKTWIDHSQTMLRMAALTVFLSVEEVQSHIKATEVFNSKTTWLTRFALIDAHIPFY